MNTITNTIKLAASVATLALVVGCSSSGGGGSEVATVTPQGGPTTAPTGRAAGNPDPNNEVQGGTIAASSGVAVGAGFTFETKANRDDGATITSVSPAQSGGVNVRVGENAQGEGVIRVADSTIIKPVDAAQISRRTRADGYVETNYQNETQGTQLAFSEDELEVIEGRFARFGYFNQIERDENGSGQAAVGFFAGAASDQVARPVGQTGTATYVGAYEGVLNDGGDPSDLEGKVTLNADFGAGTVGGRIDDLLLDGQGSQDGGVRIDMDGTIDGADYAGTVRAVNKADGTLAVDTSGPNGRASFQGGFYGGGAEETSGIMDLSGTSTDGGNRIDALGGYIATKQPTVQRN